MNINNFISNASYDELHSYLENIEILIEMLEKKEVLDYELQKERALILQKINSLKKLV